MLRATYPADYQVVLTAVAATGTSPAIVLPFTDITNLIVKLVFSAVTGTTPTFDCWIQTLGPDGNWYDMARFAQQTAATTANNGVWASVTCDDGARVAGTIGSKTIAVSTVGVPLLTNQIRLAYTVAGTTPSFTGTVDFYAANSDKAGF